MGLRYIEGGDSNDVYSGEGGADQFVLKANRASNAIEEFKLRRDHLDLTALNTKGCSLTITQPSTGLSIETQVRTQ